MGETLRRTNLGNLNPGDTVNLGVACPPVAASTVVRAGPRGLRSVPSHPRHRARAWGTPAFQPPTGPRRLLAEKGSMLFLACVLTVTAVSGPAKPRMV